MKPLIKILAFDLGKNMGWAYCTCDLVNRTMLVNDYGTIDLTARAMSSAIAKEKPWIPIDQLRLLVFTDIVTKLTSKIKFDVYAAEDVFVDPRKIQSYQSLMAYMGILRMMITDQYSKVLTVISPMTVKKSGSENHMASKLEVQEAILSHPSISFKNENPVFDQHAADAIGVCYAVMVSKLTFDI